MCGTVGEMWSATDDSGTYIPIYPILLTKGCIDLIHDIQRSGLEVVQCKYKRQGAECLLASAQIGNVLPALAGRPHAEHNPLRTKDGSE